MEDMLEHVGRLSTSAGILKVSCDLVFITILIAMFTEGTGLRWKPLSLAVIIAVPTLLFLTESLPHALARRFGDQVLIRVLPTFHVLQLPLQALSRALEVINHASLRVLHIPVATADTREIVEGFREVVEESTRRLDFDETERELLENVMDFGDVDVAAIMTPRTEIHGVDLEDGIEEVIRVGAEEGHSTIPIFEENLDSIIGIVSARGIIKLLAAGGLQKASLRSLVRPTYFVPETKLVTQLLADFRRDKRKMAIVLDEYGGTAGMVTLGDILGEIVGDIGDEYDVADPEPVRIMSPGVAMIQASLRIAEVNEALDLELPEDEDFETLGGFVLSELGHLPKQGENFEFDEATYEVMEASDRRVIRICIRKAAG
ncbi:MAG: putative hemolysin [Planctomycetota bacterium]|jgi:putative hemolysin